MHPEFKNMSDRTITLLRLQRIFREVLDNPTLILSETNTTADTPDWDSVATVQIVLAVEEEFNLRLKTEEVACATSVVALLDAISKRSS